MITEEPTIEDPKKPLKRLTNGEIIFDHVSFQYERSGLLVKQVHRSQPWFQ